MPDKMNDVAVDAELRGYTNEQASEAEQRAIEFLTKAVRIPGVRIDRDRYLREALAKVKATHDVIDRALASSPAAAGVPLGVLDFLADEAISYETNKSAALSFAAGIPGGFAMLGTIPADLTQYYVHALRIMQKLAYLYGWRDLLADVDAGEDETIGVLAEHIRPPLLELTTDPHLDDHGDALASLTAFARIAAKTAYQKHVTKRALMSITWYPVVKYSLRVIGINITKNTFSKGVSKVLPIIGGFVSSGLTFTALQTQSSRLKGHLRQIPPAGFDAEAWAQHLTVAGSAQSKQVVTEDVQETMKGKAKVVMLGAKSAASGIADGASAVAGGVKGRLNRRK